MSMRNVSNNNIDNTPSSQIIKILWRQQQDLMNKHPDGVSIIINEEDPLDIQAEIQGPKDTPYEGGIFKVKIVVGSEFPAVAPKGYCMTKIFHPNVSEKGEICVNTLKKDWNPKQWSLFHVLEVRVIILHFKVIKCLLIVPFPESSLNEEAGKLFMEDYDKFFKIANIFTNVHAAPKETSGTRYNSNNDIGNNITYNNSSIFTGNNLDLNNLNNFHTDNNNNNFTNKQSDQDLQSFKTPTGSNIGNNNFQAYQSDSAFNYNILRHSKSVSIKSTVGLKIGDHTGNIISLRKDSNLEMQNEFKSCQKPSIGLLPFLLRNTSNSISQNSENQNYLSFLNSASGLANGFNSNSGISMPSPTPRSKKDEIKKWLSRI